MMNLNLERPRHETLDGQEKVITMMATAFKQPLDKLGCCCGCYKDIAR